MKYIRKKLIITGVIMVMGLGLTGCTKTDENAETPGGSAVEAEIIPGMWKNPRQKMRTKEDRMRIHLITVRKMQISLLCTIFRTRKRIFVVIFVKSEINSLQ